MVATYQEAQSGLIDWNGGDGKLATGIYFVVLEEDGKRYIGKLALLEPGFGRGGWSLPGFLASPPPMR
jgi:hypothetical protein